MYFIAGVSKHAKAASSVVGCEPCWQQARPRRSGRGTEHKTTGVSPGRLPGSVFRTCSVAETKRWETKRPVALKRFHRNGEKTKQGASLGVTADTLHPFFLLEEAEKRSDSARPNDAARQKQNPSGPRSVIEIYAPSQSSRISFVLFSEALLIIRSVWRETFPLSPCRVLNTPILVAIHSRDLPLRYLDVPIPHASNNVASVQGSAGVFRTFGRSPVR